MPVAGVVESGVFILTQQYSDAIVAATVVFCRRHQQGAEAEALVGRVNAHVAYAEGRLRCAVGVENHIDNVQVADNGVAVGEEHVGVVGEEVAVEPRKV